MSKNTVWGWVLLVASIIGAVAGVLILGHILEQIIRAMFVLPHEPLTSLIVPGVILVVLLIIGTASIVAALKIEKKFLKVSIMAVNIALAPMLEIIDLTIRAFSIFEDFTAFYL
jgi:hypothetical protein